MTAIHHLAFFRCRARHIHRVGLGMACALLFGLQAGPASADDAAKANFPSKSVRFVVPFAPGGSADQLARPLAKKLQEMWGQPVLVENRGGAGAVIGTDAVAKSAPDGHTFGLVVAGHTINPSIYKQLPYDTLRDLAGVTQLTSQQMAVIAHPSMPFNTLPELIAYAKKNPGKVTYGSSGIGVATHLSGELLSQKADIKLLHVPYKGTTPAYTDLLGGQINLIIDVTSTSMPYVDAGRLKLLAMTAPTRSQQYRQYPVIAEVLPGLSIMSMFGVVAPAKTPPAILEKIQKDMATALQTPEMRTLLNDGGMEIVSSTPQQFDTYVASEIKRWADLIKQADIKVDR